MGKREGKSRRPKPEGRISRFVRFVYESKKDIAIVFLGILGAFAVDWCWTQVNDFSLQQHYIKALRDAIAQDVDKLTSRIDKYNERLEALDDLLDELKADTVNVKTVSEKYYELLTHGYDFFYQSNDTYLGLSQSGEIRNNNQYSRSSSTVRILLGGAPIPRGSRKRLV